VVFVLPRTPPAMAKDDAKRWDEAMKRAKDAYIAGFYSLLAIGPYGERLTGKVDPQAPNLEEIAGYPFFMANEDLSIDALTRNLANRVLEPSSTEDYLNQSPVEILTGFTNQRRPSVFPILVKTDKQRRLTMSMVDTATFFKQDDDDDEGSDSSPNMIGPPSGFKELAPFELSALAEQYVLRVGPAELRSWQETGLARLNGNLAATVKTKPVKEKPLAESTLLAQRDEIFSRYFVAMARAIPKGKWKGRQYVYEVTLNTEPLCRLGTPERFVQSK
jgi:hypothetical protein